MRHISFNPRFVNTAGNDLIPGKIHTIRHNYDWWKQWEGKEVALFTWEGKPYQKGSKQKVFCVKRIVSVQKIYLMADDCFKWFGFQETPLSIINKELARNDGFVSERDFGEWFADYKPGRMAILHFTDYRY